MVRLALMATRRTWALRGRRIAPPSYHTQVRPMMWLATLPPAAKIMCMLFGLGLLLGILCAAALAVLALRAIWRWWVHLR